EAGAENLHFPLRLRILERNHQFPGAAEIRDDLARGYESFPVRGRSPDRIRTAQAKPDSGPTTRKPGDPRHLEVHQSTKTRRGLSAVFRRLVAPGIEIKLFEIREAETIYAVVDAEREYLRRWLPWVDYTHSPEDIRQFIMRVRSQYEANQGPQAGLWIDGEFAGSVGCHPIHW